MVQNLKRLYHFEKKSSMIIFNLSSNLYWLSDILTLVSYKIQKRKKKIHCSLDMKKEILYNHFSRE